MLVMGAVADVADVGTFSEGDGERAGFDECKERQAVKRAAVNECSTLRRGAQATGNLKRPTDMVRLDRFPLISVSALARALLK